MNEQKIAAIRGVVLSVWDPLCVGDNKYLSDEYDHYLPDIIKLLDDGRSVSDVAEYLHYIEVDSFGMNDDNVESCWEAAKQMVAVARS